MLHASNLSRNVAKRREGRSTFLAAGNATIAVAKWGVTRKFFLATCKAPLVALEVVRKLLRVTWPYGTKVLPLRHN